MRIEDVSKVAAMAEDHENLQRRELQLRAELADLEARAGRVRVRVADVEKARLTVRDKVTQLALKPPEAGDRGCGPSPLGMVFGQYFLEKGPYANLYNFKV